MVFFCKTCHLLTFIYSVAMLHAGFTGIKSYILRPKTTEKYNPIIDSVVTHFFSNVSKCYIFLIYPHEAWFGPVLSLDFVGIHRV